MASSRVQRATGAIGGGAHGDVGAHEGAHVGWHVLHLFSHVLHLLSHGLHEGWQLPQQPPWQAVRSEPTSPSPTTSANNFTMRMGTSLREDSRAGRPS
jgi:hypothetical protein